MNCQRHYAFALGVTFAFFWSGMTGASRAEAAPPNIIFVLADDLGWSELGCYGNTFHETPNLDRLASEGVRFTQAYAAAPVCSPYRAALLTGQHPARLGILDYLRPNSANALDTSHVTLPEVLQAHGYATGMIGKWHLTGYAYHAALREVKPRDHGFQWDFGREVKSVGNGANFWPYVFRSQPIRWIDIAERRLGEREYLTDRLNLEAVDFIERHKERPFFLYLSHYAPHTILNGRPDLVEKYRRKHAPGKSTRTRCYLCQDAGLEGDPQNHWAGDHNPHLAAMLESIDDGLGGIMAKLEETGLADNTIVIFTSDNGGETNVTSNAPLRGGKSQLYEGGIRVPLIVRWPKKTAAGSLATTPTVNFDFYPTLLEAAGVRPPEDRVLDGVSMLQQWIDPTRSAEPRDLFWHYPLDSPHFLGGRSAAAIRAGDFKVIERLDTGQSELFNLREDPAERRDLSKQQPQRAAGLLAKLKVWRQGIGARIPSPPMITSPRQLEFADHFSDGQVSPRWFFNKDWVVDGGVLRREPTDSETTRIFLRESKYRDTLIRFDFQFRTAKEIRFVTGGSGYYNAVIHLHRDHFFIQTALDPSGPYFSYRHGECRYDFEPNRWYSMTLEFLGDELVAHVDPEHLAYARHPILNKERTYFAFQVDAGEAVFDNVQFLQAGKAGDYADKQRHVQTLSGKHPLRKSLEEELKIEKSNAHEWFYQRHGAYRQLVQRVDALDARNKKRYPEVFRTHKETRKQIADLRKKLHEEDARYKELLFATHRAERVVESFLLSKKPEIASMPESRRKRELARVRERVQDEVEYRSLLAAQRAAEGALKQAYPQLFVSDQEITSRKQSRRKAVEGDLDFQTLTGERAAAYRAQQAYLLEHSPKLAKLQEKLDAQAP